MPVQPGYCPFHLFRDIGTVFAKHSLADGTGFTEPACDCDVARVRAKVARQTKTTIASTSVTRAFRIGIVFSTLLTSKLERLLQAGLRLAIR